MEKIAIVTSTRAEFGLLSPVIIALRAYESNDLKVELLVTGTHLSNEYGWTKDEIEHSGLRIDKEIFVGVNSKQEMDISRNQADVLIKFTEVFCAERYSGIVILGDRYEMLAVAIAAGNTQTPIFHLCGGDTTEGAADEWIRHSISKMSYLHFVTNQESYRRVLQMGESPERIFNYGSTSIDNILHSATMPKWEALESIGLAECRYAIGTYHPVTLESRDVENKIREFLDAIKDFPEIEFIVTKSNADLGGMCINNLLNLAEKEIGNLHVFSSLGMVRYLSLMRHAEFVIGNSSSGIIEAPTFGIPTVNIGDRQRGRLQAGSIINCESDRQSISAAIKKALGEEFRILCKNVKNPYGDGHAAGRIAEKIVETVKEKQISLKKKFYDLDVSYANSSLNE